MQDLRYFVRSYRVIVCNDQKNYYKEELNTEVPFFISRFHILNKKLRIIKEMQYEFNCSQVCDDNYMRHVGYSEYNACIQELFSPKTRRMISYKVTQLLQGVDPLGRPIIVPDKTICSVLSSVYYGYRPPTGDIYSRYIVPNDNQPSMVQSIIDQTIEIITSNVRNNLSMEEANSKLSAWVQVLGDFSQWKLRQHAPIKTLKKRTNKMEFNMNY